MQYTLTGAPGTFDLATIRARIADEDPAALVDLDTNRTTLRVATVLTEGELFAIAAGDAPLGTVQMRREHSECCGGCGG